MTTEGIFERIYEEEIRETMIFSSLNELYVKYHQITTGTQEEHKIIFSDYIDFLTFIPFILNNTVKKEISKSKLLLVSFLVFFNLDQTFHHGLFETLEVLRNEVISLESDNIKLIH